MNRNWLKILTVGTFLLLALAGPASAATPKKPAIGPKANLIQGSGAIVLAGTSPRCEYPLSVAIKVRVKQASRVAGGNWKARCVGPRITWHLDVRPRHGWFKVGTARVVAVSKVSRNGKVVAKQRVSRQVRLKVGRGSPVGDYPISAGITVRAEPGITVRITGGGTGTYGSNCTRDETVTSVTPEGEWKRIVVSYTAKNSGSCAIDGSWSNFRVSLYGLGRGDVGYFFVGQPGGLLESRDYVTTCFSGTPHDVAIERLFLWYEHLHCQKTGDSELKIWAEPL